jgi:transmembrane sensor
VKTRLNAQILEEAAEWLVEFNSGDPDSAARRRFDAWLRASPEHLRAYLELLPVWEDGALLPPPPGNPSVDELIAMGQRAEANVVAIGAHADANVVNTRGRRSRPVLAIAASLLFICMAGGLTWLYLTHGSYSTGIGEQRSLVLEDGSTINLNAHSRVRVRFSAGTRAIELIEGQALFHVAKNPARPFIVSIGRTQVRAVGTQFDVNRRKRGTTVTVVEGTVAVDAVASPSRETPGESQKLLNAGEQITVGGPAAPHTVRANVATATAWTQRRLVFDASTLGEVVEEFNRYNTRRLVLRDRALESFPITAAFSSPDPASLVRFLEAQPTLRIVMTSDEVEISIRP